MTWLSVSFRRRPGASRPRRPKVAVPVTLLAISVLWVRGLPGQEVGGPPASSIRDTVPSAEPLVADPSAADSAAAPPLEPGPLVGDTIPSVQVVRPELILGMTTLPFPWSGRLDLVLKSYGSDLVRYRWTSARGWLADENEAADRTLSARADTLSWLGLSVDKFPDGFSRRRFLTELEPATPDLLEEQVAQDQRIDILPDVLEKYADIELELDGSGQLNSRWQTFDPCTINVGQKCNAGTAPTITPEFQLRALARGTISDRFHINVDFDQTREFNATNDLNVYYEGKPGEIIEFAEVGQVTLPLPRSQYLSRGIPAGNFGVRGDARLGPLTLRGVLAEQEGNVLDRDITIDVGGSGGGSSVLQDFQSTLDDAAYQTGQFFFLVDPRQIAGYPYIDVLALEGPEVPDSLRPSSSVKLYRHELAGGGQQQNVQEGVIQARSRALRSPLEDDPTVPDSVQFLGFFRPLVEGDDVHCPPQRSVGRGPVAHPARRGAGRHVHCSDRGYDRRLQRRGHLPRSDQHRRRGSPGSAAVQGRRDSPSGGVTWDSEMHNIHRISSANDVEWGSVKLVVSQGPVESGPVVREASQTEYAFLEIFGLDDQPRDDQLDDGRIWRPSSSGEFAGTNVLTGVYLVFKAQEPFKTPPPIESNRVPSLQGQPFPLVEPDKNGAIYDEQLDQARESSFLYRLNLEYRARTSEAQSSFSLGAIGIRQGSERVTLNGRDLTPGEDYTIDYDIGQLTLLRPGDLFAGADNPKLAVRFEQKPLFQVGTKSISGSRASTSSASTARSAWSGCSRRREPSSRAPRSASSPVE